MNEDSTSRDSLNPYQSPESHTTATENELRIVQGRRYQWFVVVFGGLLIPGLMYWMIRRDFKGVAGLIVLLSAVPVAFVFFGPVWDLLIFDGTPYDQHGLYPFLATCILVPLVSLVAAVMATRSQEKRDSNRVPNESWPDE